jgi:hypothetical protein
MLKFPLHLGHLSVFSASADAASTRIESAFSICFVSGEIIVCAKRFLVSDAAQPRFTAPPGWVALFLHKNDHFRPIFHSLPSQIASEYGLP